MHILDILVPRGKGESVMEIDTTTTGELDHLPPRSSDVQVAVSPHGRSGRQGHATAINPDTETVQASPGASHAQQAELEASRHNTENS